MNGREDITTDATKNTKDPKRYCQEECANKCDNLEVDEFLDTYNLPRQNQKEIENLNRPIMSKERESVRNILSPKQRSTPSDFTAEFYQTFREHRSLSNSSQKTGEEILSNSLLALSRYQSKTKAHSEGRKFQTNIRDEYTCENPQENTSKPNSIVH